MIGVDLLKWKTKSLQCKFCEWTEGTPDSTGKIRTAKEHYNFWHSVKTKRYRRHYALHQTIGR